MTLLTNSYETWLSYVNRYEMQCKFAHNHTYTNQHLKTNQFLYILSVWTNSLQVKRRKCGGATRVKRLWRMRRSEGYPENNKGSMRWTHFCNIPTFSPILSGRQWEREWEHCEKCENLSNEISHENHTLYEDIYSYRSLPIFYRQAFIEAAVLSRLIGYCFGER